MKMNYHVKENNTAGQKERIVASDKIVEELRWKRYTSKARTRDTGTDLSPSFKAHALLNLGEY